MGFIRGATSNWKYLSWWFRHDQIEIAEAGKPILEETFTIDLDGILTVSTKDSVTGVIRETRIKDSGNLSSSRIEELKFIASLNREKDAAVVKESKANYERTFQLRRIIRLANKKRGYATMSQIEIEALNKAKDLGEQDPDAFMAMDEYAVLLNYLGRTDSSDR